MPFRRNRPTSTNPPQADAAAASAANPSGRRRSLGQSMVEFALVFPVFLLLLVGAVDFGRIFMSNIVVGNAARAGAVQASATPNDYPAIAAAAAKEVANVISDKFQGITCSGTVCSASPQPAAVIRIECTDGSGTVACPDKPTLGLRTSVSVSVPFGFMTPGVTAIFGADSIQVSSAGVSDQLSLPTPLVGFVPTAAPTPTPTPTPEPTPTPTPTPTPPPGATPTPTPDPTPTPTPAPRCVVPNLDNLKKNPASDAWRVTAGFTGALSYIYTGGGNQGAQNWYVVEGSQTLASAASWPCTTPITVTLVQR